MDYDGWTIIITSGSTYVVAAPVLYRDVRNDRQHHRLLQQRWRRRNKMAAFAESSVGFDTAVASPAAG